MEAPLDLAAYLAAAPRGAGAALARRLGVKPVMVTQWATGTKPIPEDRAPAIERETSFVVRCEISCSGSTWVRVEDADWPHGKPLLDKATRSAAVAAVEGQGT